MALIDYMKQTVIFQRFDGTLDALGHRDYVAGNWDTLATKKCMVRPMSGSEAIKYGKTTADNMYIVYTEYVAGIREDDRLSISGDIYDILNPKDPNSLNDHYEIDCKRVV